MRNNSPTWLDKFFLAIGTFECIEANLDSVCSRHMPTMTGVSKADSESIWQLSPENKRARFSAGPLARQLD